MSLLKNYGNITNATFGNTFDLYTIHKEGLRLFLIKNNLNKTFDVEIHEGPGYDVGALLEKITIKNKEMICFSTNFQAGKDYSLRYILLHDKPYNDTRGIKFGYYD